MERKLSCKFKKDLFFGSERAGLTEEGLHDYNLKDAPKTDALSFADFRKKRFLFFFCLFGEGKAGENGIFLKEKSK